MSIDFATLQGLTIPEGVVTQIADAAGNVLWSAQPQEKIVYLRPSADISLEHPVYPETLAAGYLAICEEVSDGAATYIGYIRPESASTATSKFRMSLTGDRIPAIKRIVSAKLVCGYTIVQADGTDKSSGAACNITFYVNDNAVCYTKDITGTGDTDILPSAADTSELVSAINNHISANGVGSFPDVSVEIYNHSGGPVSAKNGQSYTTSYTTQVAIELEYE